MTPSRKGIVWFEEVGLEDVPLVGGKNASLGEMIGALRQEGINVPDGFATTTADYRNYLQSDDLEDQIETLLFAYKAHRTSLEDTGRAIRRLFRQVPLPVYLAEALREGYRRLGARYGRHDEVDVAVRSSATLEDAPETSFAGQQETFLNVVGERELLEACRKCYASLFTDRAIAYREEHGIDHLGIALSIGVQKMVRADKAGSGVMFTLDTESGFPNVVLINAGWGLGENVVQGAITPDQYEVFKPLLDDPAARPILGKKRGTKDKKLIYGTGDSRPTENVPTSSLEQRRFVLSDDEILQLARWAVRIERHYGRPMDVEWAKDGETGALFVVQARPETVHALQQNAALKTYHLKEEGRRLATGQSVGSAIARGRACLVLDAQDLQYVEPGAIVVTAMIEPDWLPALRTAAGIVTDYGGRMSHAAVLSRELGIPAVVGTGDATQVLREGQRVTLSCAAGEEGYVYEGHLDFEVSSVHLEDVPATKTRVLMNLASPEGALKWWRLPVDGVGLARMEAIIHQRIRVHPMALLHFDRVTDERSRRRIRRLTRDYEDRAEYFVDQLSRGLAKIAASQYPRPVFVRTSDFKAYEYARLAGGECFEPQEKNPLVGLRGAARYTSDVYRDAFGLECRAIVRAREEIGLTNIAVLLPFCRTPAEADRVLALMAEHGLARGRHGLAVHMMCEVPSNVVLAEAFAARFDGFTVGTHDLTQLVLGVDREEHGLAYVFDEGREVVQQVVRDLAARVRTAGGELGFCGRLDENDAELAAFLIDAGVDAVTVDPDHVITLKSHLAAAEAAAASAAPLRMRAATNGHSAAAPENEASEGVAPGSSVPEPAG